MKAQACKTWCKGEHEGKRRRTWTNSERFEPEKWWTWPGSNRRPPACKACALPAELHAHPDQLKTTGTFFIRESLSVLPPWFMECMIDVHHFKLSITSR